MSLWGILIEVCIINKGTVSWDNLTVPSYVRLSRITSEWKKIGTTLAEIGEGFINSAFIKVITQNALSVTLKYLCFFVMSRYKIQHHTVWRGFLKRIRNCFHKIQLKLYRFSPQIFFYLVSTDTKSTDLFLYLLKNINRVTQFL